MTGEVSFKIDVDGDTVTMQSRAFSGGKREKNQMDMTGAGASAKLGKISGPLAIDPFLHHHHLKRFEMKDMPKIGEWTNKNRKYFSFLTLFINNFMINWRLKYQKNIYS